MENLNNDFAETIGGNAVLEIYQSDFDLYDFSSPGPEDEEENEDEDEADGADKDKTSNEGSDDNDPPLDEDVVHSPLPPKAGGTPK